MRRTGARGDRRFFKNSKNRPKPRWSYSNLFGFGQIWRLSGRLLSFRSRLVFFVVRSSSLDRNCTNPGFFAWLTLVRRKQAAAGWVWCYWTEFAQKTLKKLDEPLSVEWKKERNKEIKQAGRRWLIHDGLPSFPTNYYLVWLKAFANKCLILLCLAVCWFGVFVFCCFGQRCRRRKKKAFSSSCSSCLFVSFSWCSSLLPLSSLCFNTIL